MSTIEPQPFTPPEPVIHDEGGGALEEQALVAALVRNGEPWSESLTRAGRLLELAGGLRALFRRTPRGLAALGLDDDTVERLQAAARLGLLLTEPGPAGAPLTPARLHRLLWPALALVPHEELHLVLLDARHRYAGRQRLASGGLVSTSVHPRDVLAAVIASGQPCFALVHNHPSGDCTPSPEDVALSQRVAAGAELIGLRLVDHLVVADDGFASALPDGSRWPVRRSLH